MFMNNDRDEKLDALRRQLAEAEAEKEAADKEAREALERAQRHAGISHSKLALDLYELLGIDAEHPTSRLVRGREVEVAVDKDEQLRTRRVFDFISALIEKAGPSAVDELRRIDARQRNERKPKKARRSPTPSLPSHVAASDEVDSDSDTEEVAAALT